MESSSEINVQAETLYKLGDKDVVDYHLDLMFKKNLIESGVVYESLTPIMIYTKVYSITWAGHDYLDKLREERENNENEE